MLSFIKKITFLVFVLFTAVVEGYAQDFYVCTSNQTLQKVTVTPNGVTSQQVNGCGSDYFSIAITGNTIYYNSPFGSISRAELTDAGGITVTSNCSTITSSGFGNALTVDKNGILYYVSDNELFSVDPANGSQQNLGAMPYGSAGDLLFYNNELYMASFDGIVKIPLGNPAASTMYIPIPGQTIFGLTTVLINNVIKVYALTAGGSGTDLLELDMQNRVTKGVAGTLPFIVYDAGSGSEAGELPVIEVTGVNVTRDCSVPDKGRAEVLTQPHTSLYTYTLNTGQTNTSGKFDGLAPGNYEVTVTSDGGETPVTSAFTIPDFTLANPAVTAAETNPVCDIKGQIKLDAGAAGTTHTIRFNGAVFSFTHIFGLDAGSYHFTILDPNGCVVGEYDYTLEQDVCPPIVIEDIRITAECERYGRGSVTVITKPHPDNYTYSLNGTVNTTGVFDNLLPGTYTLIITASGGDREEQQVTVPDFKVLNKPDLTYTVNNAVCTLAGQITFRANGDIKGASGIRYGTEVYAIGQTIKNLTVGNNHFTVLSNEGCILDELDIEVLEDKCEPVDFPNTFTPNGDAVNDIFRPNQNSNPVSYRLTIFNRLGQQMFQSSSIFTGWDGDINGKASPAGVYYWIASYTMPDGKSAVIKGWVTLLR